MLKLYKYKIFSTFLLTYLLLTEAFSSFNGERNENFMTLHDFYSGPSSLFSSEFDFSNPSEINMESNNIINKSSMPMESQIISDNQLFPSNFTWQISEHDIYNEDYFLDFTPPASSEITNNISSFISVQSETKDITSKKPDPVKKVIPEKNNTNKKRKISIEEISEFEEEKMDERQNHSPVKNNRKGVTWTSTMENRLKELKNEINPVTNKKYTSQKIAQKMTEEFFPLEFTPPSIDSKWCKIGEDQIVKYTNWNTEMDNFLNELNVTEVYTWKEIAEIMTKKFPSARFTEGSVEVRWNKNRDSVEKDIKSGVRWTSEMEEYLKDLKNKKNPTTGKKYTHKVIASIMTEKFSPLKFTEKSVIAKWNIIGKNQIVKNTVWNIEMQNLLRELKPTEDHTYAEIAEIMINNFPSARFTEGSVATKWKIIKKKNDKEK